MKSKLATHPEMRLFNPVGKRLYLTKREQKAFLEATKQLKPVDRMHCHLLYYTGVRHTEALNLTIDKIDMDQRVITIKTLKQRKFDNKGRVKLDKFRDIPVPSEFIEDLDLVFNVRELQKKGKCKGVLLWSRCRTTMYRMIKNTMAKAGIAGDMASPKGLRHSYGVNMVTAKKSMPIHVLSRLMGHSNTMITEIYLEVVGEEYSEIVNNAWGSQ